MIPNIVFTIIFILISYLFYRNVKVIIYNINLGKDLDIKDNQIARWKQMFLVAIGQSKMVTRPISGILHIFVYAGFLIVNVEMLEILIDGVAGTHRLFAAIGLVDIFNINIYNILVSIFEVFGLSVMIACIVFLSRRNIVRVKRFWSKEMTSWPRLDANIILMTEVLLMTALFFANASDSILQARNIEHYVSIGSLPISGLLIPLLDGLPTNTLIFIERFGWWFHIVGVFAFLNFIPYSKHFHVFLAFPNVFYSKLKPLGYIANMPNITKEVKLMLSGDAFSEQAPEQGEIERFGAKRIKDLTWKQLMDSYTCTECGRCTSVCPANITGKKLSPRKVIMDTRDCTEVVGKKLLLKKSIEQDIILSDLVTNEEIWACTTCNACAVACPVNIDHVSIILDLRKYKVMEKGIAPAPINSMFSNIENNGAPWQYSNQDRLKWLDV